MGSVCCGETDEVQEERARRRKQFEAEYHQPSRARHHGVAAAAEDTDDLSNAAFPSLGGTEMLYSQRALPHESSSACNISSLPPSPPRTVLSSQGRTQVVAMSGMGASGGGLVGLEPLEATNSAGHEMSRQMSTSSSIGGPSNNNNNNNSSSGGPILTLPSNTSGASSSSAVVVASPTRNTNNNANNNNNNLSSSSNSPFGASPGGAVSPALDPEAGATQFLQYVNGSKSNAVARSVFECWCIYLSELEKADAQKTDDLLLSDDNFSNAIVSAATRNNRLIGGNYGDADVQSTVASTRVEKWATLHASEAVTHESIDEMMKSFMLYLKHDLRSRGWGGEYGYSMQGYEITGVVTVEIRTERIVGSNSLTLVTNYHAVSLL